MKPGTEPHRVRLSGMMFVLYLVMGTWAVSLGSYLMATPAEGGLGFPPSHAGWIYSTLAIAGIVAPFFLGLLADRLFPAEKLLGVLYLVAAVIMYRAARWCDVCHAILLDAPSERAVNDAAETLFAYMLAYSFCNILTVTLSNVIGFRNLVDPKHGFGQIRLWGTVGWIVAGVQVAFFWNALSATPLYLTAGFSVVAGLYAFTLPHTPPTGKGKSIGESIGLPALAMFRERSFCVLTACALGMAVAQQFYGIFANRYLHVLHAPYPTAVQTFAQFGEVAIMAFFPWVLRQMSMKTILWIGLVGLAVRNALFAYGSLPIVVLCGLPLHGLSYAFFFIVAGIYIDHKSPPDVRASAQGIFAFISMGAGTLAGNWLSASIVAHSTTGTIVDWQTVWLVPTGMGVLIAIVFALLFRGPEHEPIADETLNIPPTIDAALEPPLPR